MKKIKSIIFALLMVTFVTIFTVGCGKKTTTAVKKNNIKVQSITGSEQSVSYVDSNIRMAKLNASLNAEPAIKAVEENKGYNYFVIFKSKTDISIKVIVSNPEAIQIDMVKVASSDEAAKIKTYNNQQEVWQNIAEQPVVGWNGSNVYETSWDVKTTKDASEVTFTVTDFKVNNEWQQQEDMGNNVLHVYKLNDGDITLNILSNGFKNNDVNKPVEQVKIACSNESITIKELLDSRKVPVQPDENGIYTFELTDTVGRNTTQQQVYVKYTFKLGNTGIESEELITEAFNLNLASIEGSFLYDPSVKELYLNVDLLGDAISNPSYIYYYNGTEINSIKTFTYNNVEYLTFTNDEWNSIAALKEAVSNFTVKVNGNINFNLSINENGKLTFQIVTE